ncbi:MAG: methyltransferase domain-containing protein [Candidatus Omnitrophota bacterium]
MGAKKILKRMFGIKNKKGLCGHYWESYNRSFFIANKIKLAGLKDARLLDVGGNKKDNLLAGLGIKNITVLNILKDADIVASAHKIPLADKTFEYVACMDMLEHVPQEAREQVIKELVRVAKIAVFIVAPIDSKENNLVEEFVLKYLPAQFVKEHRVFGLVNFDRIKSTIEAIKKEGRVESFEESDLDNLMPWTMLLLGDKVEPSKLYQELYFLENKFHPRRKAFSIYLKQY